MMSIKNVPTEIKLILFDFTVRLRRYFKLIALNFPLSLVNRQINRVQSVQLHYNLFVALLLQSGQY